MTKAKRIALYVCVSTDDQTVENQKRELQAWAHRCGHSVVKVFEDRGISGSKGRDKRPGFDAMLKAAVRRPRPSAVGQRASVRRRPGTRR